MAAKIGMEDGGMEDGGREERKMEERKGELSFREMRGAGRNLRIGEGLHSVHLVTLNPVTNEKGWIIGIPFIGIACNYTGSIQD
jgi:hypothetical protein